MTDFMPISLSPSYVAAICYVLECTRMYLCSQYSFGVLVSIIFKVMNICFPIMPIFGIAGFWEHENSKTIYSLFPCRDM